MLVDYCNTKQKAQLSMLNWAFYCRCHYCGKMLSNTIIATWPSKTNTNKIKNIPIEDDTNLLLLR